MNRKNAPCPCGSSLAYGICCGPWHAGAHAPTALALMRSRYCAYALNDVAYLAKTWHASTRPPSVEPTPASTRWIRLDIKSHDTQGDHATVEFVAVSKAAGRAQRMHERSRFVRESGQWFYLDGEVN